MSDVNVQLHFICCRFRFDFRCAHSDCQLEVLVLALVISVFFRYWHWRIKIHLVFGNYDIPSSWFTVSLEIFGEKFCISSGVRAQQLERPAHHNPFYFTISGQSASHVFQDIVFHSRA